MNRIEMKQETMKKITNSITELITTSGYENIKVRDICKNANISIGTFYNYYTSKDDILVNAMNQSSNQTLEIIKPQLNSDSAIENLLHYVKLQTQLIHTFPIAVQTEVFRMFLYGKGDFILDRESVNYAVIYEIIKAGKNSKEIQSSLDIEELTYLVLKIITANCYHWCMTKGAFDIDTVMIKEISAILT